MTIQVMGSQEEAVTIDEVCLSQATHVLCYDWFLIAHRLVLGHSAETEYTCLI